MKYNSVTIGSYLAVLVGLIDQLTKMWVLQHIPHGHVEELNPFINLVLSWNKGVTFGILNGDYPLARYAFIGVAGCIVAALLNWMRSATSLVMTFGLGLVIGGAIGNVVDRFRFGAVVDFIDFHIDHHHWYTFNIGDSAIVCGVTLLMLEHLVTSRKKG